MNIDRLPSEVLLLVLAYLRTDDLRSLALTFNNNITDACVPLLQPLSVKIRNERDMTHRFRFQGLSKADFVDVDDLQRHEGLSGVWHQWIDIWNMVDGHEEELPSSASLGFLSVFGLDVRRCRIPSSPLSMHDMQALSDKATSLDVKVPPSFWKAMSDHEIIDKITMAGKTYVKVKDFDLLATYVTKPKVGYLLPFLHEADGLQRSWYLYLEPGEERRSCILSILNVFQTTNIDDECIWDVLPKVISAEDRRIAKEHDIRVPFMDSDNIRIAGFDFRDWLAHRLFNEWLEVNDAFLRPSITTGQSPSARERGSTQPNTTSHRKRRTRWLRRVFCQDT